MFHILLHEPEIPPNTGNIMRLCANTGFQLHLIEPLGFELSEKSLRRAGLDYLKHVRVQVYANFDEFMSTGPKRIFYATTKAQQLYTEPLYQAGDVFAFGPETRGLPDTILNQASLQQKIKIPMIASGRSLNLANAVSIITYEAWRQCDFFD